MKTLFTTPLAAFLFLFLGFSARSAVSTPPADQLLPLYFQIKDALVLGDAGTASVKSAELEKALSALNTAELTEAGRKSFDVLKDKLIRDAGQLAKSKDLEKQRSSFEKLSSSLILLAKSIKLSDKAVYEQYCPMKKASWLSMEKLIKNPYYGRQMLGCGQLKESI